MMLTYRHSQNPSQSDAAQKFLGAKAPIGWHAWPLSPTSLASQRGHRGARRPRGSPGPARCTWLRPRGGRLSGRRSCAGSGRAVAGRLRTRCSARRAWLGHGRSLTLSLYLRGTPQRPPSPPTPPPRLAAPASSSAPGLAPSGPEQPAGRRRARSLSDDNPQDLDLVSPLHRHLPCLLFSLRLTKSTQEGNSLLPPFGGSRSRGTRERGVPRSRAHNSPKATSASASPKLSQETCCPFSLSFMILERKRKLKVEGDF